MSRQGASVIRRPPRRADGTSRLLGRIAVPAHGLSVASDAAETKQRANAQARTRDYGLRGWPANPRAIRGGRLAGRTVMAEIEAPSRF